ncbi:MAG: hypothetical protein ABIG30_00020 [Candidatus Aenigmatarchaeota archaeon]
MGTLAKVGVAILSIIFLIFAPLVIFGFATKPIFYDPAIAQSIIEKGITIAVPEGTDFYTKALSDAMFVEIKKATPQLMAYLRGDSESFSIKISGGAMNSGIREAMKSMIITSMDSARPCNAGEQPELIGLSASCNPPDVTGRDLLISDTIGKYEQQINIQTVQDIDLGKQMSGLEQIRGIMKMGFGILNMAAVLMVLILVGVALVLHDSKKKILKAVGGLLVITGISTFVTSIILVQILERMAMGAGSQASFSAPLISGLFNIIVSNAQTYSLAVAIIGAILFIIGVFLKPGKEPKKKKK